VRRWLPVLVAIGMAATVVTMFLLVGRGPSPDEATGGGRPVTSSPSGTDGMTSTPAPRGRSAQSSVADEHLDDVPSLRLPDLPDTGDPDVYATAVAEVLFGMDHAAYDAEDYESLFASALWDEITADDRARIMATISRRIPTADIWRQMRAVGQVAELDVELVWEPRISREYRTSGTWPDGWVMRTVSGTQTETWRGDDGDTQSSASPVAVTVAMACPPAATSCALIGILPRVES
jgi:hypothetical protein